jgi:ABC-type lipoprotein export system ATPase subunit
MREQYGQTIIIVTHDKELAEISNRIIEIKDGKI